MNILPSQTILRRFHRGDVVVFAAVISGLFVVLTVLPQMTAAFSPEDAPTVSLEPQHLAYYALRSWLRMMLALVAAFVFSIAIGYAAAKNRAVARIVVPALDILQSVPVLAFLSFTVIFFMSLFPGSLLGLEAASIFAIFTSQVWNMTYAFYHSLTTLPTELDEVSRMYRMTRWQRFLQFEMPHAAMPLIWNAMMSISGGWFFVVASEVVTVRDQSIALPGLGSYIKAAIDGESWLYAGYGIAAILLTIIGTTMLITRPLVVWSQKFKYEQEAGERESYFLLGWLQKSSLVRFYGRWFGRPLAKFLEKMIVQSGRLAQATVVRAAPHGSGRAAEWALTAVVLVLCAWALWAGVQEVRTGFSAGQMLEVAWLGALTMLRVAVVVVVSSLIWIPIGVWVGLNPKAANFTQPIIAVLAAFPTNCLYPIAIVLFLSAGIAPNWGSIVLLSLGAQWYVAFNVIAGAARIPKDLLDATEIFRLGRWEKWKTLILPAIFPFWITGALTAAGGAWNATIVAEFANWGNKRYDADGLGRYIAEAYAANNKPALIFSVAVMTLLVVVVNRLLWQRLYENAEKKYALD